MASNRCPGCGAPYNGRKCRRCLYQPMTAASPASVQPRKKPTAKQQKSSALRSLLGFLVLLILIGLLLPILRNWGTDLKATAESNAVAHPLYAAVTND